MDQFKEESRLSFNCAQKAPYGRNIKPPIEICSRKLENNPMYPLMLYLCFSARKNHLNMIFSKLTRAVICQHTNVS